MAVGSEVEKKMEFRLYNTMSKTVEVFKPIVPGKVGMYVCGVTAYDLSHIGHARAAVVFDVLFRYLQHLGYEVTYVRNFTDIDDKIIKRANDLNEDPFSLSNRFCEEYLLDMGKLQCLPPTYQPRVTEHMDNIKNMITQIVQNGCGYAVEGDVFFAVEKSPNYGQLSGRKLEDNRAGERVAVDLRKRNPADFALWKAAKEHEPRWDSSWGPGRPGWHIECSAMSAHYLSFKFDIHGGGSDLIFPHHENEVAQSGAACSESKINYWIHNGHVTNNHLKMSKSLGNFFTIRQTLHDCEVALLPFQESLKEAGSTKTEKKDKTIQKAQECITSLQNDFEAKMSEDLNTSHVLTGAFHEALKFLNANLSPPKKKQQKQQLTSLPRYLAELANEIERVLRILGLLPTCSYSEVLQQLKEKALIRAELEEDDVARLIEDRKAARKNKEFARSDEIRADLAKKGIALMDVGTETVWRPCVPVVQEEDVAVAAVEAVGLQEQSSSKSSVPS
ncbi:Cysteine--tRNA ligase 2, cytoplasmic [Linum perenne]